MAALTDNAWAGRQDTHNRTHIPSQPRWHFILRIAQLVVALIVLILTAYAAGKFGSGNLAGFGLAWFTFILTAGYIAWLFVAIFVNPAVYNYWAQLALEIACVIFWLCTWAVLASEAADFGTYDGWYDYYWGHGMQSAVDCIKASAGLGALVWLLFVVTFVFFLLSLLHHRKTETGAAGGINMHETKHTTAAAPVDGYPQQPAYAQPTAEAYLQQTTETYTQPQAYAVPAEQAPPQQQAYAVPAHQQV
ncbi:hypothetical protein DL546_002238 [Coniochaeta pulveracea]|uniref:MARVEL domain-containing protein n=1 Tax=Coniochaeta pulveracea TaxID=177199 RepID=A0A420XXS4_9PEZI|nr:hypothetical protein DL546_002238 [Coniochaeta pulveracea]